MRGGIAAVLVAMVARPLAAQGPLAIVHMPVRLAGVSVAADTISGLVVIVEPGMDAKQGKSANGLVWLQFHPDSALEWINSAVAALGTPVAGGPEQGIQWSRTLVPASGKGALALGRQRKKGVLQATRWLAVSDSATGWRVELNGSQADSLLKLLLAFGSQSRLDTASTQPYAGTQVEVPVRVERQAVPRSVGIAGRALVEFVVGPDGTVEPGSFAAYLLSDSRLAREAWEVVRQSRYRPAEKGGRPVRQRVQQSITWHSAP